MQSIPSRTSLEVLGSTLFQPAWGEKPSFPAIHVVMTLGRSEGHIPNFDSIGAYYQSTNGKLPELNYYVALSADRATSVQRLATKKFDRAAVEAKETFNEASARVAAALETDGSCRASQQKKREAMVGRLVDEQAHVSRGYSQNANPPFPSSCASHRPQALLLRRLRVCRTYSRSEGGQMKASGELWQYHDSAQNQALSSQP